MLGVRASRIAALYWSAMLLQLDNVAFRGEGLPLCSDAARFFWAIALRDAVYGPTDDFCDCFEEFLFEAGLPSEATRPVSSRYLEGVT